MAARTSRRWFPLLRAVLTLARQHARLADATERIADALEGYPRSREAPGRAEPDAGVDYMDPAFAVALEREADRLTPLLGRPPTPEELLHAVDGVEWTAADAEMHRRRVAEELADRQGREGR